MAPLRDTVACEELDRQMKIWTPFLGVSIVLSLLVAFGALLYIIDMLITPRLPALAHRADTPVGRLREVTSTTIRWVWSCLQYCIFKFFSFFAVDFPVFVRDFTRRAFSGFSLRGDRVHRRRRDTQGLHMHGPHDMPEEDRPNSIPMVPLAPVTAADDARTVPVPVPAPSNLVKTARENRSHRSENVVPVLREGSLASNAIDPTHSCSPSQSGNSLDIRSLFSRPSAASLRPGEPVAENQREAAAARINFANQINVAFAHFDTRMRELMEEPSMNVELPNETSMDLEPSGSSNVPMPARSRSSASMRISSRVWSPTTTPSIARNASSATTPATNAHRRRSRPITIPLYSHNPHDVAKLLRGLETPQQVSPSPDILAAIENGDLEHFISSTHSVSLLLHTIAYAEIYDPNTAKYYYPLRSWVPLLSRLVERADGRRIRDSGVGGLDGGVGDPRPWPGQERDSFA